METWKAACPNCGVFDTGIGLPPPDRRGTFLGNATSCPICGGSARLQDHMGAHAVPFPKEVFAAFRSADVVDLDAFRDIALAAASGKMSKEEAEQRAARLDPRLTRLLQRMLRRNGWQIMGFLATLAGLVLSWKALTGDDELEAKMEEAWRAEASQNELMIEELRGIANQLAGGPPPPAPVPKAQPRRMTPDEFKIWWNSNRKV